MIPYRNIARPLLPEKTRNKVNILGGNWKQDVLKVADVHSLPAYWNEEGADGPFLADVKRGVPFPEEQYYKELPNPACQVLSIPAGKVGYIDIQAQEVISEIM